MTNEEHHILLITTLAIGIVIGGLGGYMARQSESTNLFITSCNNIYGVGEWNVMISPLNNDNYVCMPISYITIESDNITLPVRP